MLLVADIFSDCLFVQSNGTHTVSPRPKTVPCQVLRSTQTSSMDQTRRLSFQLADCMGLAVLGGIPQHRWMCSALASPSTKSISNLRQSSLSISPTSFLTLPYKTFFLYFGMNTIWYRQYHRTWACVFHSLISTSLTPTGRFRKSFSLRFGNPGVVKPFRASPPEAVV